MLFRSIGKCALVLSLLATTVVYAKDDKIPCPAVSKIQQAAQLVDWAGLDHGTYNVGTSAPAFTESNLNWAVGAIGVSADSADAAIEITKASIQKASIQNTEYAIEVAEGVDVYVCGYGPGEILAIGLGENSSMSPAQALKKVK